MFKSFQNLTRAINNEISIDIETMERIEQQEHAYTPIRPLKSYKHLKTIPANKLLYTFINIGFLIASPIFYTYQLISTIKLKLKIDKLRKDHIHFNLVDNIILKANHRTLDLYNSISKFENSSNLSININQKTISNNEIHILQFIKISEIFECYLLSNLFTFSKISMLFKLNILQCYVSFDWLVRYRALKNFVAFNETLNTTKKRVFFSNHYDRWAVMFDTILSNYSIHLIQHGMLPHNLKLPYKLKYISNIYTIDKDSQKKFVRLFDLTNEVSFHLLEKKLILTETPYSNSVLMIGHPYNEEFQVKIIYELLKIDEIEHVFIKPHPLYSFDSFKEIRSPKITLIYDSDFFPKVKVALSQGSTLAIEYENSNINVIETNNKSVLSVKQEVKELMSST